MILDGQVLGRPLISYKDTQSAIESLTGVVAGMTAYATDTELTGYYTGVSWVWGIGSFLSLPQYHFFVGDSSGSAVDAGTGLTYNPSTNQLNVDNIQWNLTPTPVASAEGLMYWNSDDGTLNLGMPGGDVNLQLGQEMLLRAKNGTGSTIANGNLVYISGGVGSNAIVSLAQANSELLSASTIGMATEDILDGQFGYITLSGMVRDINTSGSSAGTMLYLSPSVPGGYTGNKPVAPNHSVCIGTIIRSHATEGVVFIRVDNGFEISELHDVLITTPVTNQVLQYNSSGSYWQNSTNTLSIAGNSTINGSLVGNMTGGGTVATGGFTGTIPETMTFAGRNVANTFTAINTFTAPNSTALTGGMIFTQTKTGTDTGVYKFTDWTGTIDLPSNAAGAQDFYLVSAVIQTAADATVYNSANLRSFYLSPQHNGSGTINTAVGGYVHIFNNAAGNISTGIGYISRIVNIGAGKIVNTRNFWAMNVANTGAGTVPDNQYAFYSDSLTTAAAGNYLLYGAGLGRVRIGDDVSVSGGADRIQLDVLGYTTQTAEVARIRRNDGATNTANNVLTLGANSTGTSADNFGGAIALNLESSTTADQSAGYLKWQWTYAAHTAKISRVDIETTGPGKCAAWGYNGIDGTARYIINNITGDVTEGVTVQYVASEVTGTESYGGVVYLEPSDSFAICTDGTNTLTITCAADGSLYVQRSAGTDTFKFSCWLVWQ